MTDDGAGVVRPRCDGSTGLGNMPKYHPSEDLLIDYRECPATSGTAARLVIVGAPAGITPGVAEFTVFGEVRKP